MKVKRTYWVRQADHDEGSERKYTTFSSAVAVELWADDLPAEDRQRVMDGVDVLVRSDDYTWRYRLTGRAYVEWEPVCVEEEKVK